MTHANITGTGEGHAAASSVARGPFIVAMDNRSTQNQEAYYLFFVASVGMALNLLVIVTIFLRHNLRKMTSAFLVHASILNLLKATFCIFFGLNLLSSADISKENQPPLCKLQGSAFVVLVTTSAINMVAMVCTEAYTFGEENVGGNPTGTRCCILFGILVVYVTSIILHLGPTLIGGDIIYNPDIGSCAFRLGESTGYVANIMWVAIITVCFVGLAHFLKRLYAEIQSNRPNRVSMLVRHSISIGGGSAAGGGATGMEEELGGLMGATTGGGVVSTSGSGRGQAGGPKKPSAPSMSVHEMTQEALHRAKLFVITGFAFALCWYPLFLLMVVDLHFMVSPKVYQAFNFIAWTEATVEPIILICFDRSLNLLARFLYCDRDHYTAAQIAFLMAQHRNQQQHQHQPQQMNHQPLQQHAHNHLQQNHLPPPPPSSQQHPRHISHEHSNHHQHDPHHLPHYHHQRVHSHNDKDDACEDCFGVSGNSGGGGRGGGSGCGAFNNEDVDEAARVQNSIALGGEAFHETRGGTLERRERVGEGFRSLDRSRGGSDFRDYPSSSLGRNGAGEARSRGNVLPLPYASNTMPCRHCSPIPYPPNRPHPHANETTPLRPSARYGGKDSAPRDTASSSSLRGMAPTDPTTLADMKSPLTGMAERDDVVGGEFELAFSPLRLDSEREPLRSTTAEDDREGDVAF